MVRIRKLDQTDATTIARLLNNKKIWDNLRDYIPFPYTESDANNFISMVSKEEPQQTFGIEADGLLCGAIGLVLPGDVYQKTGELGYWLGEPFWGQGIITEAIRLITIYGFEQFNLERMYAAVFEYNKASMKVLEKNGYILEGISRNAIYKNNKLFDEYRYALLKKEHKL